MGTRGVGTEVAEEVLLEEEDREREGVGEGERVAEGEADALGLFEFN